MTRYDQMMKHEASSMWKAAKSWLFHDYSMLLSGNLGTGSSSSFPQQTSIEMTGIFQPRLKIQDETLPSFRGGVQTRIYPLTVTTGTKQQQKQELIWDIMGI